MDAIIEVGSNSLKLLIYRTKPNFEVVSDETVITRLSEEFNQTGLISSQALERNIDEIKRCLRKSSEYKAQNVYLYGTMIFRSAKNSSEVLQQIYQKTGLKLSILSGEDEATYSFYAATNSLNIEKQNTLVIDTGGGSTEFIFGKDNKLEFVQSLDIGAVTLTDRFNLKNEVTNSVLKESKEYINSIFSKIKNWATPEILIGIGGTVTTISAIVQKLEPYSAEKIQSSIISLDNVIELERELSVKNIELRKDIIGLSPKRADIILGGVLIIRSILEHYGATEMIVCDQGLRYGLALKEWRKK